MSEVTKKSGKVITTQARSSFSEWLIYKYCDKECTTDLFWPCRDNFNNQQQLFGEIIISVNNSINSTIRSFKENKMKFTWNLSLQILFHFKEINGVIFI